MRAALRSLLASVCPTWRILCLNEPSPCLHLFRQEGSNQQAGTDKILSKMTSAATAAGCGTERRGGREREKRERGRRTIDQKRHGKERWPDCSAGQEHGKEAAGKAGPLSLAWLSAPSGGSLCDLPLLPYPLLSPHILLPALLPVTAHYIGTKWSALTSSWTRVIIVAVQGLDPLY